MVLGVCIQESSVCTVVLWQTPYGGLRPQVGGLLEMGGRGEVMIGLVPLLGSECGVMGIGIGSLLTGISGKYLW